MSERELLEFRRRYSKGSARTFTLSLILADGSVYDQPGKLVLADNRVDPETGTLLLEAEFPNPEKLLQAGQFARIKAVTDIKKDVVIIPQTSSH